MEFNYKSLIIGLAVTLVWYTFFIYTASYEAAVIAPLVGGYAANYYQKEYYLVTNQNGLGLQVKF